MEVDEELRRQLKELAMWGEDSPVVEIWGLLWKIEGSNTRPKLHKGKKLLLRN